MLMISLLVQGCFGDAPETPAAATDLGASHQTSVLELGEEIGTINVEIQRIGLYDSAFHQFSGPSDVDASKPGPRLVAVGRMFNGTSEHIVNGGVFTGLEICHTGQECINKKSHDRGFVLPLSNQDPWRPGEWRQFVSISRPHKAFFRELSPSQVRGTVDLDVEGGFGLKVERSLWRDEIDWSTLGGVALEGHITLSEDRRIARRKYKAGTNLQILGMSGMHVALQHEGRRIWGSMDSVPEAYQAIGSASTPLTLPHTVPHPDLEITVQGLRSQVVQDKKTDRTTRYAVIDLRVVGKRERAVRLQARDLVLLKGDLSHDTPSKDKNVATRPISFDRLPIGESHEGEVHFKCPLGVNPLRLQIKVEGKQVADLVLPAFD
jgi:hypothetical protein